ncbi:SGNH hydrolase [Biscogniauxia mediterranea]|nr:SGNH hydrolase [Biscogniauxia mediterranea]
MSSNDTIYAYIYVFTCTPGFVGFVALGDSYSVGSGTGVDGREDDCRHGLHANPQLIASDLSKSHGGPNTAFLFLSCTGPETEEVFSGGDGSQIDAFNASLPTDFALISIDGNDLGFFGVMNACVFRFYNFYSGTCETALNNLRAQTEGDAFESRLQIIIMELLDKNGPKLAKELRQNMNALVLANKVLFVDYDEKFDGHRFCEENVTEPDYGHAETWLFLLGDPDNANNDTLQKQDWEVEALLSSSALVNPSSCLESTQTSGDWGELALCYMAVIMAPNSMWYVPTYYGKTLHPRSMRHETIRDKIYET